MHLQISLDTNQFTKKVNLGAMEDSLCSNYCNPGTYDYQGSCTNTTTCICDAGWSGKDDWYFVEDCHVNTYLQVGRIQSIQYSYVFHILGGGPRGFDL